MPSAIFADLPRAINGSWPPSQIYDVLLGSLRLKIMYPFTDIANPGPSSNGRFAKRALLGLIRDLTEASSELKKFVPSSLGKGWGLLRKGAGATGSLDESW